jgi:hypothetical protein
MPRTMRSQNKKNSTWPREGVEMVPQDVSPGGSASGRPIAQAWDPYDVWLNRVKLPRERQPQRLSAAAEVQAAATAVGTRAHGSPPDDPLLLPGVS